MSAVRAWLLACIVLETANAAATNLRAVPKPSPKDQKDKPRPKDVKDMTLEEVIQQEAKIMTDPKATEYQRSQEYQTMLAQRFTELMQDPKMKCAINVEKASRLPSDAESLDKKESDKILKDLQGEWKVVPLVNKTICPGVINTSSTDFFAFRAVVDHDVVTFSGGQLQGSNKKLNITLRRSNRIRGHPILYLDEAATVITNFAPEKGVVDFKYGVGLEQEWQRILPEKSTVTLAAVHSSTKAKTVDKAKSASKSDSGSDLSEGKKVFNERFPRSIEGKKVNIHGEQQMLLSLPSEDVETKMSLDHRNHVGDAIEQTWEEDDDDDDDDERDEVTEKFW